MKTISLLVPTRERPNGLRQYLETVANTTKCPNRITVMIAYDDDDKQTIDFIPTIGTYPFKIKWCKRGRSNFINEDYYNFLARQCASEDCDYLFANADDIRWVAMDWDMIIESKIEMYCSDKPDRIVGVGVKDNTPKPKPSLPQFPCFPLVTRESLTHFGFILHSQLPTWGADYTFFLLFNGADRYLPIDDRVYMHHVGIHTHTGPKDETAKHVERVFHALKGNPKHNPEAIQQMVLTKEVQEFKNYLRSLKK